MNRLEWEKHTIRQMIELYCRHKERNDVLCRQCSALLEYARGRLSKCTFGDAKTSCRKCPVHCYRPDMKEQIRQVMRYSGPRMLLYHPLAALRHIFYELR